MIPPGPRVASPPVIGVGGRVPRAAQPWPTEPLFLHVYVRSELDGGFDSDEEFNSFIARMRSPDGKPDLPPATHSWHQAEDLAYKGWEEKSAPRRAQAAHQALQVSPDAVDGYLLLAHDAADWAEAEALCTQAVAAGERLMGPDAATAFRGKFWEMSITRPYMRARFALGYCLWRQDRRDEAAAQFRDLLGMNPKDNQFARYVLLAILLEMAEDREAQQVMARYAGDAMCYFGYNHALLAFRKSGDAAKSRSLLKLAFLRQPLVPTLLLRRGTPPAYDFVYVEPMAESEALEYHQLYAAAWSMTPGALDWLEQLMR